MYATCPQTLAVIPARGGSVGVPQKNLRHINGVPLIGRAIQTCLRCALPERLVVSTDCPEIAATARSFGAEVVIRPHEISGPTANSWDAIRHAVNWLESTEDYCPEVVVWAQCTSPLMEPDDMDGVARALYADDADSAMVAVPFECFVWERMPSGSLGGVNHDHLLPRSRRQEITPQFLEAGIAYAAKTSSLKQASPKNLFGKIAVHVVPFERFLDINTYPDLERARIIIQSIEQQKQ